MRKKKKKVIKRISKRERNHKKDSLIEMYESDEKQVREEEIKTADTL